jgi:hypothetical protein
MRNGRRLEIASPAFRNRAHSRPLEGHVNPHDRSDPESNVELVDAQLVRKIKDIGARE